MSKRSLPPAANSRDETVLHIARRCSGVGTPTWSSGDRGETSPDTSRLESDPNVDALLHYSATHHCSLDAGSPGPPVLQVDSDY